MNTIKVNDYFESYGEDCELLKKPYIQRAPNEPGHEKAYFIDASASPEVIQISSKEPKWGAVAVIEETDNGGVSWAVFEFVSQELNGLLKPTALPVYALFAYGRGYAGGLREARHTYFNPYMFYLKKDMMTDMFNVLSKYFDFD
jgi:hypothetical protein